MVSVMYPPVDLSLVFSVVFPAEMATWPPSPELPSPTATSM